MSASLLISLGIEFTWDMLRRGLLPFALIQ